VLQVEVEGDQGSRRCNGRKDKPFYISGLYDNPRAVIHTLDATAGAGNYRLPRPRVAAVA